MNELTDILLTQEFKLNEPDSIGDHQILDFKSFTCSP